MTSSRSKDLQDSLKRCNELAAQPTSTKVAELEAERVLRQDRAASKLLMEGTRYDAISLDNPDLINTDMLKDARAYCKKQLKPRFYLLLGQIGNGKTTTAVGIVARLAEVKGSPQGDVIRGRFVSFAELANRSNDTLTNITWREELGQPEYLILDDVKARNELEYDTKRMGQVINAFNELINIRYSKNRKKTILTSNASGKSLAETYGARTWSRISESAFGKDYKGADFRKY